jgi:hypothetical protein
MNRGQLGLGDTNLVRRRNRAVARSWRRARAGGVVKRAFVGAGYQCPMSPLSFERDIGPLFRIKDRDSMMVAFDLFDYADVAENADAIVASGSTGGPRKGRCGRITKIR